jgi:hypothetical protein
MNDKIYIVTNCDLAYAFGFRYAGDASNVQLSNCVAVAVAETTSLCAVPLGEGFVPGA